MFNEIVGNTRGVNNNSDLCPDGDGKLLDENSESHCSVNAGPTCDNSKLIHVGDNSKLYSNDDGTLFGS
jgi:hypothetical protein